MTVEIIDCIQGEPEWFRARLGLPTASNFATVMARGKDGGASLTRKKYLNELAAEIITGEPGESYTNGFMERGKMQEAEARRLYAFMTDADPELVGFIKNGPKGASPDALIGNDGLLEVKTRLGHLQVELLLADRFPPEHRAQIQGSLWVCERDWCDIAVFSPGLPLYVSRQWRDDGYIANLSGAVAQFCDELAEIVERVKRYGEPPPSLTQQLTASLEAMP